MSENNIGNSDRCIIQILLKATSQERERSRATFLHTLQCVRLWIFSTSEIVNRFESLLKCSQMTVHLKKPQLGKCYWLPSVWCRCLHQCSDNDARYTPPRWMIFNRGEVTIPFINQTQKAHEVWALCYPEFVVNGCTDQSGYLTLNERCIN